MNKEEIVARIREVEKAYDELELTNGTNPDTKEMEALLVEMGELYDQLSKL